MADRPFLELLRKVRELTWECGALLIVDDRVDAALIAQADGVHLGQDDLPLPDARRIAPDLLLGVSTHNAAEIARADGVHLGQDDIPLPDARRLAPDLLIGVSTHNAEELIRAQDEGCSYLNIGPIFPTNTKQLACAFLGMEQLKSLIPLVRVPFSVMGGIKFGHLAELKAAGAGRVAAVTAFTQAQDPGAEAAKWRSALC